MAKRQLTSAELDQLSQAALNNALELLADARLLFDAKRWPRAYALAALAGEEVGKYEICREAASSPPCGESAWKAFWHDWKQHRPKIATMTGPLVDSLAACYPAYTTEGRERWEQVRVTLTDRDSDLAKAVNNSKMAAFYVDFDDDAVLVPAEIVHRNTAENMINTVSRAIAHLPHGGSPAAPRSSTATVPASSANRPTP
ncbi:AbiV family abortive infection protein [Lentzea sp. BCCO 10_0856]|uniref:AbiV family abortive infection protein n=1 Tax=Lentzea miocenica TaxID=3095431 RepID=A0ABU4TFW4_9PSEU|nr:AbiV family abortive infection protein [Lentzea sp. BCCO 10_0856]MDX8036940.1 AbiV family abortive infection protein [Lentzea sp. BCCO 10_0856]